MEALLGWQLEFLTDEELDELAKKDRPRKEREV